VVDDFMSVEPIATTASASIGSVARRMVDERVHRVIVLDEDGCLTGFVTSLDLLKALTS
jgi:predicted transcriptional regulator